jgi:hypothetical protein
MGKNIHVGINNLSKSSDVTYVVRRQPAPLEEKMLKKKQGGGYYLLVPSLSPQKPMMMLPTLDSNWSLRISISLNSRIALNQ